jgi:hypothetical protein
LAYNIRSREFIDKNKKPFGWITGGVFFYGELLDEQILEGYFGKKTNKLLLTYLRNRFPDLSIYKIE